MGMILAEDGTFQWRLAVGSLDLSARGNWEQSGDKITLTSERKPVPPAFAWSGLEKTENAAWFRVVWSTNGKPFQGGSATMTCKNGWRGSEQVYSEGLPDIAISDNEAQGPPGYRPLDELCDEPETVRFYQSMHNVSSPIYDLRELGWSPGQTARFEFQPNDLGLADMTGMTGTLDDNVLRLFGGDDLGLGSRPRPGRPVLELRKLTPHPKPE